MNCITIEVFKEEDIPEYSALMVKVMEEFNQGDINDFQYWFTSIGRMIFYIDKYQLPMIKYRINLNLRRLQMKTIALKQNQIGGALGQF